MKLKIYDRYLNITNREGVQDCTEEKLEKFKSAMEGVFGEGSCYVLSIRPFGGTEVSL